MKKKKKENSPYRKILLSSQKRDKYLHLARELKIMEHEGNGYTSCYWCSQNNSKDFVKGLEDLKLRVHV